METKFEVIPVFPTPIYTNEIPEQLVQDHISLLDSEKLEEDIHATNTKEYGHKSINTYILNQDFYKNLSNYILQHSTNFCQNYLSYDYKNYKFSQSWISVKNTNDFHIPHNHPHSLISGVLFFGEIDKKTSSITFLRDDQYSITSPSHPLILNSKNPFSFTSYSVNYIPNTLILFPSYLPHSVSKNVTNIPRKSLAFNIVPTEGFGVEGALNRLKFN